LKTSTATAPRHVDDPPAAALSLYWPGMRRSILPTAILVLAAALPAGLCGAAPNDERDALMQKGVELHDAGSYKAAIETYQKILEKNPRDVNALYEIGNTYLALGDFKNCLDFARRSLAIQSSAYTYGLVSSCQEENGDAPGAIETFRKALETYPGDVTLNFNYAVTLGRQNRHEEAKQHLRVAINADPRYASPFLAYAAVLANEDNTVGAMYMWLRFLMLEPGTQRSRNVSQYLKDLLAPPVDAGKDPKTMTLRLPPAGARREEFPTDPQSYSTALQVLNALDAVVVPKENKESDAQRFVGHAGTLLRLIEDQVGKSQSGDATTFVWENAGLPIAALGTSKLREVFLYYVAGLANMNGATDWLEGHTKEFEDLKVHLAKR